MAEQLPSTTRVGDTVRVSIPVVSAFTAPTPQVGTPGIDAPLAFNATHARVLKYFTYSHLPDNLQQISKPLADLAIHLAQELSNSADPIEVTHGLRKLLEAKDCFVRARLS